MVARLKEPSSSEKSRPSWVALIAYCSEIRAPTTGAIRRTEYSAALNKPMKM